MRRLVNIPEFEVQIRLRNNLLVQRREQLDLTQAGFARILGMSQSSYNQYECMRTSPMNMKTGRWKEIPLKIAEFWGESPENLWPDVVRAIRKAMVRFRLDGEAALMLVGQATREMSSSPEALFEFKERDHVLGAMVKTSLTPRESVILSRKFGLGDTKEHTYQELAAYLEVYHKERPRQIAEKSLRKLRHRECSEPLKEYLDMDRTDLNLFGILPDVGDDAGTYDERRLSIPTVSKYSDRTTKCRWCSKPFLKRSWLARHERGCLERNKTRKKAKPKERKRKMSSNKTNEEKVWNNPGQAGEFMWVPKGDIEIDHTYQRDELSGHVNKMAKNFTWRWFGTLSVERRSSGRLFGIDGQQRLLAALKRPDITEVPCMVHVSKGVKGEAADYSGINNNRRNLQAYDKFKSELTQKIPLAVRINEMVQKNGYHIKYKTSEPYSFMAIGTLWSLSKRDEATTAEVFRYLAAIAIDGERIHQRVFHGMYLFVRYQRRGGYDFLADKERMQDLKMLGLKNIPKAAKRVSQDESLDFEGPSAYAYAIFQELNRDLPKNQKIKWYGPKNSKESKAEEAKEAA